MKTTCLITETNHTRQFRESNKKMLKDQVQLINRGLEITCETGHSDFLTAVSKNVRNIDAIIGSHDFLIVTNRSLIMQPRRSYS